MNKKPQLVPFQDYSTEEGRLNVVEVSKEIGFVVNRVYWLHKINASKSRGAHAHKELWQCFIAMAGSFTITLKTEKESYTFKLDQKSGALIVPPGYWRDLTQFSEDAVCAVLASHEYNESDYLRNYEDFMKWRSQKSDITKVPYLDFKRSYEELGNLLVIAGQKILSSGHYIMGPEVEKFEKNFADYCEIKHCLSVSNGLEAIELVLKAWGIGPGDEVIVAANSFVATALAVSNVGAKPVLVDNNESTFNLDPSLIEKAITKNTKAIALTHLYGQMADMYPIVEVAKAHKLKILEDAAQAHGAKYNGLNCGALGDAATFSFYPTKNLGAYGDGGAIITNDSSLAETISYLRNYGAKKKYHHDMLGTNSRLDEIQAAFLNLKLPLLDKWNQKRKELAQIYFSTLEDLPGIVLPQIPHGSEPVWHVFAIRVLDGKREPLMKHLDNSGVGYNIHYPVPIHEQLCYVDLNYKANDFPVAHSQSKELLSLPLDAYHSEEEIKFAAQKVRSFFN